MQKEEDSLIKYYKNSLFTGLLSAAGILAIDYFDLSYMYMIFISCLYAVFSIRYGFLNAQLASVFQIIIMTFVIKIEMVIFYYFLVSFIGSLIGYGIGTGHLDLTILSSTVSFTAIVFFTILISKEYYNIDFFKILNDIYISNVKNILMIVEVETNLLLNMFKNYFLVYIYLTSFLYVLAVILILKFYRRIYAYDLPIILFRNLKYKGFNILQMLVFVFIAFLVSSAGAFDFIISNIVIIISILFALQGYSVILFLVEKRNINSIFAYIALALSFIIPYLMTVLALLGLVDNMANIRRLD